MIGPIINSGGRLGYSNLGTDLLSSNNISIIKQKTNQLIKLNNKRKIIEKKILDSIDFKKIHNKNTNVIILKDNNISEGMIGIIAARLKEYFNKPSIVITNSNYFLKGSARSTINYNVGNLMKILIDKKIIEYGGGHNMAAGFTIKKEKINIFEEFIQKDFLSKNLNNNLSSNYDAEISPSVINHKFISEMEKLGPFGNENSLPNFLFKNLKIIKSSVINNKHISVILKPRVGKSFKSISFNSASTNVGNYLMSYKKNINVIGQIHENNWNNKKSLQLYIKDILI